VEVSAGAWHTIARRSDGEVVAWGRNTDGQCDVPALPAGKHYVEVAAGGYHSVARRSDGVVVAWGQNYDGQCNVPLLPGGVHYEEIAAGLLHTVARRSDGKAKAWGSNNFGQANAPWMSAGQAAVRVAAGEFHSLLIRNDGVILSWGANSDGQIAHTPQAPQAPVTFVDIAAGGAHSLAALSDGSVIAWGRNVEGQCDVPAGGNFVQVAAGGNHSMGIGTAFLASKQVFGTGCPASQPLTLSSNLPIIGTNWQLQVSNVQSGYAVFVFGTQAWTSGYDLGFVGAPGCFAYTNAELNTIVAALPGNTTTYACPCPVPVNPSLAGFTVTAQVAAPWTGNALGMSTSNGLTAVVGY